MPIYEAKLSDGRTVKVEADQEPSETDILQALEGQGQAEQTSAGGAFGRALATSVLPTAAAAAVFPPVAAAATALAGETGPAAPLIGIGAGGLAAGGAAFGVAKGQKALLKAVAPETADHLEKLEQADIVQHPIASGVGRFVAALPSFTMGPIANVRGLAKIPSFLRGTANATEAQMAKNAIGQVATQGALTTGQTLATEGRLPTKGELAEAGAAAVLLHQPRFRVLPNATQAAIRAISGKGTKEYSLPAKTGTTQVEVPADAPDPLRVPTEATPEAQPAAPPARKSLPVAKVFEVADNEGGGFGVEYEGQRQTGFTDKTEAGIAADAITRRTQRIKPDLTTEQKQAEEALHAAAGEVGETLEMSDEPVTAPADPSQPFAQPDMAIPTGTGLKVYRPEFHKWLAQLPKEKQAELIQSLLNHERVHRQVRAVVGETGAETYWNNLTSVEKALVAKRYASRYGPNQVKGLSDAAWGHEALRGRLQVLMGQTPAEVVDAVGSEHWSQRAVYALERIIYRLRQFLGTKASARQQEIIDRVLTNLSAAKEAVGLKGDEPAALRRWTPEDVDAYQKLQKPFGASIQKLMAAIKSGDESALAQAETERMGVQRQIEDLKNRYGGTTPDNPETAPAARRRNSFYAKLSDADLRLMYWGLKKSGQTGDILNGVLDEIVARSESKNYFTGTVEQGSVKHVQHGWGDSGKTHRELGLGDRNRWRYEPTRSVVRWTDTPNQESLDAVDNFLARRGITPTQHESWVSSHVTYRVGDGPGNQAPAARRRPSGGIKHLESDEPGQGKLFDPSLTAQGVPGEEPEVKPVASESGALPPLPGTVIEKKARDIASGPISRKTDAQTYERPRFKDFVEWAKANAGGSVSESQLQQMWADQLYGDLLNGTPERLALWRKALHLEEALGDRPIPAATPGILSGQRELNTPIDRAAQAKAMRARAEQLERSAQAAPLTSAEPKATATPQGLPGFPPPSGKLKGRPNAPHVPTKGELLTQAKGLRAGADLVEAGQSLETVEQTESQDWDDEETHPTKGDDYRSRLMRARDYRTRVIGAIAEELLAETLPSEENLSRKKIELDEVDFGNPNTVEGAYRDIALWEAENPDTLRRILRDRARASSRSPESHTLRLVAMVDKNTHAVELVSTFNDAGVQRVCDPANIGLTERPNRELDAGLLKRYRPISSLLLKEPVKSFRQHFESVSEFEDVIAKEARDIERQTEWGVAGEAADLSPEESERAYWRRELTPASELEDVEGGQGLRVEPKPGVRGEGGGFIGDEAGVARTQAGFSRGELRRNAPLTPSEVGSIHDFLTETVGKVETPEDMTAAFNELIDRAKAQRERPYRATGKKTGLELLAEPPRYRLRGQHFTVISALSKIADRIAATEPQLTPDQAYEKALDRIFSLAVSSGEKPTFIQRALGEFAKPAEGLLQTTQPAVPGRAQAPAAKELTMRERIPPTVDPNVTVPKREGPTPEPPGSSEPAMLDEAAQRFVRDMAAEEWPVEPSHYEAYSRIYGIVAERPATPTKGSTPAAVNRRTLEADYARTKAALGALISRRDVRKEIPALLDGADGRTSQAALNAVTHIELASGQRQVAIKGKHEFKANVKEAQLRRRSVDALIACGDIPTKGERAGIWAPQLRKLKFLYSYLRMGEAGWTGKDGKRHEGANDWIRSANPIKRAWGSKWLDAIQQKRAALDYAKAHWNDPVLQETVRATRQEFRDAIEFANQNGATIQVRENYVPGRYEGDFWNDNSIMFAGRRILGSGFRLPRKFASYYEALAHGPYIPASYDVAELVGHSIRQMHRMANRGIWANALQYIDDPDSKQPIAVDPTPIMGEMHYTDEETGQKLTRMAVTGWRSPSTNHTLVWPSPGSKPIAVRLGFEHLVNTLVADSHIQNMPLGRAALNVSSSLKHGIILVLDTFHPMRVGQYAISMMGGKMPRYRGGYSALAYRESDLPEAIKQGHITKELADWATEKIKVGAASISRKQLADMLVSHGLNAVRFTDAINKGAVRELPLIGDMWHKVIGPYNKWLFDRFMPGLMVETAVNAFEKMHAAHPDVALPRLVRDIVNDTNIFYGNMGRQGIFRNATFRDLAQIFVLAPAWQEGLFQKEIRFYSRMTGLSKLTGRGQVPYMGLLGSGMAKGLTAYFALSQIINLVTRGHFTWDNPEEGHKLDAFVPMGPRGFWLSPLSLFGEVLHDVIRLTETRPKTWDAIVQMGENRLGPLGKLEQIMRTGRSPSGEYYTTTGGVLKGAAAQLAPTPIALGTPIRALASSIAPKIFSPPPPGGLLRQSLTSLASIKTQPVATKAQQVSQKAIHFLKAAGLRDQAHEMMRTDEPSYSKLRSALRNEDQATATNLLAQLRKTHTDAQMIKAMTVYSRHPFTGSKKLERLFISSLSDQDLELYSQAVAERMSEFEKFAEWYGRQP